jgi:hypothetical protein
MMEEIFPDGTNREDGELLNAPLDSSMNAAAARALLRCVPRRRHWRGSGPSS